MPNAALIWRTVRLATVCCALTPLLHLHAEESRMRLFTQLEIWGRGGAYDMVPLAGGSMDVSPAVGVRGGAMFLNTARRLNIGGSVGLIFGPWGEYTRTTGGFGNQTTLAEDYGSRALRFLFEAYKEIPVGARHAVKLGGGAGVARRSISLDRTQTGADPRPPFQGSVHEWGLTWEIMPTLVITGRRMDWEFGIGYAHFPTVAWEGLNFSWKPIGVKAAVRFR